MMLTYSALHYAAYVGESRGIELVLGALRAHAETAPRSTGRRGACGRGARCGSQGGGAVRGGGGAGDGGALRSAALVINSRGETASDLARSVGATGPVYAIFAEIEARARASEVGGEPSGAPSAAPTCSPWPSAAPGATAAVATPAAEPPRRSLMFDLNESESDDE